MEITLCLSYKMMYMHGVTVAIYILSLDAAIHTGTN
jgi:hypothetical protein